MSDKFDFLSEEWFEAARKIRDDLPEPTSPPAHKVKMNLVIEETPFEANPVVKAHVDSSEGEIRMDGGHLDEPNLTVTVDYATAKAIFVDQNPAAGMQAFMAGKVKVQGDMTKLMAMQQGTPDAVALEASQRIKEITA